MSFGLNDQRHISRAAMDTAHPTADSALRHAKRFRCCYLAAKKLDQVIEDYIHGLNAE